MHGKNVPDGLGMAQGGHSIALTDCILGRWRNGGSQATPSMSLSQSVILWVFECFLAYRLHVKMLATEIGTLIVVCGLTFATCKGECCDRGSLVDSE